MARIAVAVLALALGAQAAHASSAPAFAFGRSGGNILPFTVVISSTGRISARGPVDPSRTRVSPRTLARLLPLARREGFFAMPPTTIRPGTLPDLASLFVAVTTSRATKRVTLGRPSDPRFS